MKPRLCMVAGLQRFWNKSVRLCSHGILTFRYTDDIRSAVKMLASAFHCGDTRLGYSWIIATTRMLRREVGRQARQGDKATPTIACNLIHLLIPTAEERSWSTLGSIRKVEH
jgi:hypothetical protein